MCHSEIQIKTIETTGVVEVEDRETRDARIAVAVYQESAAANEKVVAAPQGYTIEN